MPHFSGCLGVTCALECHSEDTCDMNSMERYGTSLVTYEGVADLTFLEDSGIAYRGYFEARQLTGGGIAIGFVPVAHDAGGSATIVGSFYSEPSFRGRDMDGWDVTTCGQTLALPILGSLDAPKSAVHPTIVFSSRCIRAKRDGATQSGYGEARFLLSNLLWHSRDVLPEPIELEAGGMTATATPLDDYVEVADRIMAVRGIAPTAEVLLKTSDGSDLTLERYRDFMNNLVSVFRLATGNRVDWYYGEASEAGTDRVVERFHKHSVTGPLSRTVRFRQLRKGSISGTPRLNFQALAKSFLDDRDKVVDRDTLKKMIDYFVNACDETSYLEARGLLASTLLDMIVLKYASAKRTQYVMEEKEFKRLVLPTLKRAIKAVPLLELKEELRKRAIDGLQGAYRRSFRQRLKLLMKDLNVHLDANALGRAVAIRNKLVHSGTYLSANENDDWYNQYKFMIWLDLVALCRLSGYNDDLPLLRDGRPLEV